MSKSELLAKIIELNDQLGALSIEHTLVCSHREAVERARRARASLWAHCVHSGAGGSPAGAAVNILNGMRTVHLESLQALEIERAIESLQPQLADAIEAVEPIEAALEQAKAELQALEELANKARCELAAKIADAQEKALNAKPIQELKERLAALE